MSKLRYLVPRIIRHFMPDSVARWLLKHRFFIHPGLETSSPEDAVREYQIALQENHMAIEGKRILILGYGGRFAVSCELLRQGAKSVILTDPFAPPDDHANAFLLARYSDYLEQEGSRILPRPGFIHLLQGDIRNLEFEAVDLVLSNSVFEHVDDVEGIAKALARLTRPDGAQLHFIDLRDHYFKYPFEMLTFPEKIWKNWLNPTSNLNRFRLADYERIFQKYYEGVNILIRSSQLEEWERAIPCIRPEFISGKKEMDAATLIRVVINP
jgi:SAM-dependent methyltransferase